MTPVQLDRPAVARIRVDLSIERMRAMLERRLQKHGPGAYAGPHETLGIIAEEYHELVEAVQSNDMEEVAKELVDVAVACVFGLASLQTMRQVEGPDD